MADFQYEQHWWEDPNTIVIGVDEVGRGCLAGPVTVGAVCFHPHSAPTVAPLGIRDSKQLSAKKRSALLKPIQSHCLASAVASSPVWMIDTEGIVPAITSAVHHAVRKVAEQISRMISDQSTTSPTQNPLPSPTRLVVLTDSLSIDGITHCLPDHHWNVIEKVIPKGDQHSISIAAASILAKCHRDATLCQLANRHPLYGWHQNVGYGTKQHRDAIQLYGICKHHRTTFIK